MGPGQTAQGENRVGGLPHRLREPVGAADEKGHVRDAVVLPAPEPFGERAAGQLLAVLVESAGPGAAWDGCQQQRALLLLQRSEEHTSELQSLMLHSYAVFA